MGTNPLFGLITGGYNTAKGWNSPHTLNSSSFNTAIGAATLVGNTANKAAPQTVMNNQNTQASR